MILVHIINTFARQNNKTVTVFLIRKTDVNLRTSRKRHRGLKIVLALEKQIGKGSDNDVVGIVQFLKQIRLYDITLIAVVGTNLVKPARFFEYLGFVAIEHFVNLLAHKVGCRINR